MSLERDGLGFSAQEVNPQLYALDLLMNELDGDEFETVKNYLEDKIEKNIWRSVEPADDYSQEGIEDFKLHKSRFFRALKEQYGLAGMIEMLKQSLQVMQKHWTIDGYTEPMVDFIERVENKYQEYKDSRRAQGLVVDEHFVGREQHIRAISAELKRESTTVSGVLVCGMYGMGKTSLATQLCLLLEKEYSPYRIDLKQKETVKDAFFTVMSCLKQPQVDYHMPSLTSWLANCRKKTLLLFDNADDLMELGSRNLPNRHRVEFIKFLEELTNVENGKVKIMLTSRYKLANPDHVGQESVQFCTARLDGRFQEYELPKMSQEECVKIIDNELGQLEKKLAAQEKLEIARNCGYCPLGVRLAASHLKLYGIDTTIRMAWHPSASIPMSSVTTQVAVGAVGKNAEVKNILRKVFDSMDEKWKRKLMKLTVFEKSSFNIHSIQSVLGLDSTVEATLEVQYLKCRHLVEVEDDSQYNGIDFYQDLSVRYSLHTLTIQFLQQERHRNCAEWASAMKEAETGYHDYYDNFLNQIAKLADKDAIASYRLVSLNDLHLKKMLTLKHEFSQLSKCEELKDMHEESKRMWLFEKFLCDEERRRFFVTQAHIAEQKGLEYTQCHWMLWLADQYFTTCEFHVIDRLLNEAGSILSRLERRNPTQNRVLMLKAQYDYVYGRMLMERENPKDLEKALNFTTKSVEVLAKILKDDILTARSHNIVGCVLYRLKNYKDSSESHEKAYKMMRKLLPKSIHFHQPLYLMNVGTCKQKQAEAMEDINFEEACKIWEEALAIYNESLGLYSSLGLSSHHSATHCLRNKVQVLCELGRQEEAMNTAKENIDLCKNGVPESHPGYASSFYFLGSLYLQKAENLANQDLTADADTCWKNSEENFMIAWENILGNPNYPINHPDYALLKKESKKVLRRLGRNGRWSELNERIQMYEDRKLKNTPNTDKPSPRVTKHKAQKLAEEANGEEVSAEVTKKMKNVANSHLKGTESEEGCSTEAKCARHAPDKDSVLKLNVWTQTDPLTPCSCSSGLVLNPREASSTEYRTLMCIGMGLVLLAAAPHILYF